jgi:hypothetical protein
MPSSAPTPATRELFTRNITAQVRAIHHMSEPDSDVVGSDADGVTPNAAMTSQAAATLTAYWPTLNATFHGSLRRTSSPTSVAIAVVTIAGSRPQT